MNKYLILVVLYNKALDESDTLKALLSTHYNLGNSTLVVWDNSQIPCLNTIDQERIAQKINLKYCYYGKNESLSVIYNKIVDEYANLYSFLILLDHDTNLPPDYFFKIEQSSQYVSDECALLLPQVYSNNTLVSPARIYAFYGRYFKKVQCGYLSAKHVTAINSGMVISMNIFHINGFRYDSRLTFYGIDDYFMREYLKNYSYIYVLDCMLEHSLDFFNKNESFERKEIRFKNMIDAMLYMNNSNIFINLLCRIYIFVLKCRFHYLYKH